MRFIDSSVFVHAILKPSRRLERHEAEIKENAKSILRRIEEGEEAATTVVHVSEVANILESRTTREESWRILSALVSMRGVSLIGVTGDTYRAAVQASSVLGVGVNDTLAYIAMAGSGVNEAYSFDKHFDQLPEIKRITS